MVGFVLPLRRRVTDSQVALYLEEKDPTLEAAILSAIETSALAADELRPDHGPSPQLVEKLVDQAIEKCRAIENGIGVERAGLQRQLTTLGGVAAVAALLIAFGPAFLRSGMSALLIISRSAEAASPYKIEVTPGNTKIPRGADQTVKAKLSGFTAADATLMVRTDTGGQFERVPLVPAADPAAFEGMLFHVEKTAEYYVDSNGVESPRFKMDVRRPADGRQARARVPLPRLHRPRAAHGRSGRRHRRDQGHGGAPEDHADDGDAGRAGAAEREATRCR